MCVLCTIRLAELALCTACCRETIYLPDTAQCTPFVSTCHILQARQVLLRALHKVNSMVADTWAAVQCLAMENVTERIVVDKLITMTQSLETLIRVTATKLLVRLSQHSVCTCFICQNSPTQSSLSVDSSFTTFKAIR